MTNYKRLFNFTTDRRDITRLEWKVIGRKYRLLNKEMNDSGVAELIHSAAKEFMLPDARETKTYYIHW